jgi:hypothetical protein
MDSRLINLEEEKEIETGATTSRQGSIGKEKTGMDDEPSEKEDGSIRNETSAESEDDEGEYPDVVRMLFIVIALVLSVFLACLLPSTQSGRTDELQVALDGTIVATAIPKITDEFHGLDLVGWYGSAYFLTLGSFQSTWGKAYKYFPLKITFLCSVFVFELGSLICGTSIMSFPEYPSQILIHLQELHQTLHL